MKTLKTYYRVKYAPSFRYAYKEFDTKEEAIQRSEQRKDHDPKVFEVIEIETELEDK